MIKDDFRFPLHIVCSTGNLDKVKSLCNTGNIETCNKYNSRPIHVACLYGHLGIVEYLHQLGWDIDDSDNSGNRLLHEASQNGSLDIVKYLCNHQCKLDAPNLNSWRPIHFACKGEHVEIVRHLCEQGCNIEVCTDHNQRPLHLACMNGNLEIVRILCEWKCDIEAAIWDKDKPIQLAYKHGHVAIAEYLIQQKCNIESIAMVDRWTTDPRHFGPQWSHIEAFITEHLSELDSNVRRGCHDIRKFLLEERPKRQLISLDNSINKKPLPHNKVIQYSKEILEGLKFLHRNKIIHRYIKPANIMLNAEDHVKLCDFGLSCYLESIGQRSQIHTADSSSKMTFCGTPNYMAPELVLGQKYSYPVDIWALGASVVEMLTGVRPFHGMEYCAIIFHISTIQKIEFVPAQPISEDMESFVDQMLCPSPSSRATAEELLKFTNHCTIEDYTESGGLLNSTPSSSQEET